MIFLSLQQGVWLDYSGLAKSVYKNVEEKPVGNEVF
jgi:hypothetical protein